MASLQVTLSPHSLTDSLSDSGCTVARQGPIVCYASNGPSEHSHSLSLQSSRRRVTKEDVEEEIGALPEVVSVEPTKAEPDQDLVKEASKILIQVNFGPIWFESS